MKYRMGIRSSWAGSTATSRWRTRVHCSWVASRWPAAIRRAVTSIATKTANQREFCGRRAQGAIGAVIPKASHDQLREGIELALADLAEHGVTSAQDYSPAWENFQIYEELEKQGKLTARV